MNRISTILAVLFATLFSIEAFAWGGLGHRTIATLAERHLTPKAKANIEQYTKGTPLADYAVWLDQVRKFEDQAYAKATDGWHASIADTECKTSQALRDKRRQGRDAVTATLMYTEMFKNRKALTDSTVLVALKSLIHMVGDIHCPAHVRFTDNNNDGKYDVYYYGYKRSLHKIWDTSVIAHDHKGWTPAIYAEELDTWSKDEIKNATRGWIEEWFEDAARDIRPVIDWAPEGAELGQEFQDKALPVAEHQMRKAGYQLAKLLNTLFN